MPRPRVVILGAGFGGLACARALAGRAADVLLVDRNNYHLFTPLLYQVASSLLNPSDIAYPVRAVFRGARNVLFRVGRVVGVDFTRKVVGLDDGAEVPYDYVVVATGSATHFFGIEAAARAAHGLKDLPEALALRNHVLRCFEAAARQPDRAARRPWLTFAVAGAGPTGVEYAGALAELVRLVLAKDFPELDMREVRILLVEARDEVLPAFAPALGRSARAALQRRHVEVRLGATVVDASADGLALSDGERVPAKTLVWAAGVRPGEIAASLDVDRTATGRIRVDAALRIPGRPGAFAIGDVAAVDHRGREMPMLSAPAIQEGRMVARNILRAVRDEPPEPFRYVDKGIMATIGRNAAVAEIGRLRLRGLVGWVAWLTVHLYFLIGFRNRLAVLLEWAWDYFRYDRPIRLIVRAAGEESGRGDA